MKIVKSRKEYLKAVKEALPCGNPRVLEIGVERGSFSEMIFDIIDPAELHLLDPWEWNPNNGLIYQEGHMRGVPTANSNVNMQIDIERKFAKQIADGIVHIHRGYSHELEDRFAAGSFDFIYLDGCHLYESVKQDLNTYVKKVAPDGILGGHDYITKEVTFEQEGRTYSNQLGYGVQQAVDEFLLEHPDLELFLTLSDDNPFRDWAIRRKS